MSFTEEDAKRVLKAHFKAKDVRSIKKYTGSSERSEVYIGLLIGDDERAFGAGVLKIDEDRLDRESDNCEDIRKMTQDAHLLLDVESIHDEKTQTNVLIFKGAHGVSGELLDTPKSFGDFAKENIADPQKVWNMLEKALQHLRPLYEKSDIHDGKCFEEIEPYKKIFNAKKDVIQNSIKGLTIPDCLDKFDSEFYEKLLKAHPDPDYMKLSWIHGDLNPTNILISGDQPYVIDFASSRAESHLAFDFLTIETQLIISILEDIPLQDCYDFCQQLFSITPAELASYKQTKVSEIAEYSYFKYPICNNLFAVLVKLRAYAFQYLTQPNDKNYAFKDYHGALALYAFAFIRHKKIIQERYPKNGLALCLIISKLAADSFYNDKPELNQNFLKQNPYRGLETFREEDAPFYFGRSEVIDNLQKDLETKAFIPLIGASGSGKSSLVFAGLLPRLRQSDQWLIAHFRPKNQPFWELVNALIPLKSNEKSTPEAFDHFLDDIENNQESLARHLQIIIQRNRNKRILLIIDQFEELYINTDKNVQNKFINQLIHALPNNNITLLLTMRADFMSHADSLFNAMNTHHPKFLASMNTAELREVIEKPAKKFRVRLESGLTDLIIKDLENEPGYLPLLEFTLTQLWERRSMSIKEYRSMGGVNKAISEYADQIYQGFDFKQKQRVRQIFVQLVHPGQGTEDTRQIAHYEHFKEEDISLIQELADKRLVVTSRIEKTGEVTGRIEKTEERTVEIVHEALIHNWQRLQDWMNEDRAFREWQERLRTDLKEKASLTGAKLANAKEWLKNKKDALSLAEQEFIQHSLKIRNLKIFSGAFVVIAILSVFAFLWLNAEKQRIFAEKQKIQADEQKEIAYQQKKLADEQREKAIINETEALSQSAYALFLTKEKDLEALIYLVKACKSAKQMKMTIKPQMISIFNKILHGVREKNRFYTYDKGVTIVHFSPEGSRIASGHYNKAIIWDIENGVEIARSEYTKRVNFSPDGSWIALVHYNTFIVWNVEDSTKNSEIGHIYSISGVNVSPPDYSISSVKFSPDGSLIASETEGSNRVNFSPDGSLTAAGNDITIWNVQSGQEIATFGELTSIRTVDFSPDGSLIALESLDDTVRIWNVQSGREIATLKGHTMSVNFSPDGSRIALRSGNNIIRIWNIKDCIRNENACQNIVTLRQPKSLSPGEIQIVKFSPLGTHIASGSEDGTVTIWNIEDGKEIAELDWVHTFHFSPNNKLLASGHYLNNNIEILNIEDGKQIAVLKGHTKRVNSVQFSPDNEWLISGSDDNTVRIWDIKDGKEITTFKGHEGSVLIVCFSPDGKMLASGSEDRTVRIWNMQDIQNIEDYIVSLDELLLRACNWLHPYLKNSRDPNLKEEDRGLCDDILAEGKYDKTIADFFQAIPLNPNDYEAYISRGVAYYNKGGYDKAFADFNQAISLNPKNDMAYNNRGSAYYTKGEYDKAFADFNQAISLNPKNDMAYNNRGNTYSHKGEYDKAISDYNQAVSLNPKDSGVYNDMSWMLSTCPDDKYRNGVKAIEFAQKALESEPNNPALLDTLSAAYAEAGRFEDAVKTQEKAISLLSEKNKNQEFIERLNFYKARKPWREKPRP